MSAQDLEQFREAVRAYGRHEVHDADSAAYHDRLLALIDNAGKLCPCGEATCTESWEPGCGLGESVEHAVPAEREPPRGDELRAILAPQPAPVVDDAMVEWKPRNRTEAVALAKIALAHLGVVDAYIDNAIARMETDAARAQGVQS